MMKMMRKNLKISVGIAVGIAVIGLLYVFCFSAPGGNGELQRFVVPLDAQQSAAVQSLKTGGFIRNAFAFELIHRGDIAPGGYHLADDMNVFQISRILSEPPYMEWVVIPEGLTKARIATLLAQALDWTSAQKSEFLVYNVAAAAPLTEGIFFPDTYLIPLGETVASTTERLYDKFNEKFAPYAAEALKQNVKWTTVVKFASLIQAEAAGPQDMQLISGILWNRLLSGMRLQVDAASSTYREAGLPAQPIDNPGLEAISAVLDPTKTNCLYYLHDQAGVIHCAATYAEHEANIKKYLQ